MKQIFILFFLLTGILNISTAQVEHNFKMAPEKTDCHKLVLSEQDSIAIQQINNATFRITEEIRISRYHSPNKASFFSCDGLKGFIIVRENEDKTVFYSDIPKVVWDSLSSSSDPIGYYNMKFKKKN